MFDKTGVLISEKKKVAKWIRKVIAQMKGDMAIRPLGVIQKAIQLNESAALLQLHSNLPSNSHRP